MKSSRNNTTNFPNTLNYLELTPKCAISHQIETSGLVTLLVPRFESKFWRKFINQPEKKSFIYLHLDESGSETWLHIDGKNTVQDICIALSNKLGEKIHPAEERITKFLTQLYKNKYISFLEIV